jgi:hypothetical protein
MKTNKCKRKTRKKGKREKMGGNIHLENDCITQIQGVHYKASTLIHLSNQSYDNKMRLYINKCYQNYKLLSNSDICLLFPYFELKKVMSKPSFVKNNSQLIILIASNIDSNIVKNDILVGIAQFTIRMGESGNNELVVYLENICTAKNTTVNCKFGKILFDKIQEIMKSEGITRIEVKSFDESSTLFYRVNGYTEFLLDDDSLHFYKDLPVLQLYSSFA